MTNKLSMQNSFPPLFLRFHCSDSDTPSSCVETNITDLSKSTQPANNHSKNRYSPGSFLRSWGRATQEPSESIGKVVPIIVPDHEPSRKSIRGQ
ncbi:hypothetical protein E1B28_001793 [Marasmius oreades]|uniref:Uncharacterized protein n=1 Tax=Marasmius oreades TaxID=181124 RepID=A0A9P7V4B6_9AGAR|nr:uncharacterized protein E1B28_001793 [Marasmius oreades]KAG7100006.1 hypothetical protein E1B28_001793 [Marasmius oreades]